MGRGRTEALNQPFFCGDKVVDFPLIRGLGKHGHNSSHEPAKVLNDMIEEKKKKCIASGKQWSTVDAFGFGDDF